MARLRRFQNSQAFTLIEILVVIVIIGVLSIMGVSKYTEFTTASRKSACVSNENAIDKTVGVWESQNVAIPTPAADSALILDTNGQIKNSVTPFNALSAPAGSRLSSADPASLFRYSKDANLFCCPERANIVNGVGNLHSTAENDYEFHVSPTNLAGLGTKMRGVYCLFFGGTATNGPDGTPATRHQN